MKPEVLSNPSLPAILKFLHDQGVVSHSDIKNSLGISTAYIYGGLTGQEQSLGSQVFSDELLQRKLS